MKVTVLPVGDRVHTPGLDRVVGTVTRVGPTDHHGQICAVKWDEPEDRPEVCEYARRRNKTSGELRWLTSNLRKVT